MEDILRWLAESLTLPAEVFRRDGYMSGKDRVELLTKLTYLDDVEAYLHIFKVVAEQEGWDETEWSGIIAPLLTERTACLLFIISHFGH